MCVDPYAVPQHHVEFIGRGTHGACTHARAYTPGHFHRSRRALPGDLQERTDRADFSGRARRERDGSRRGEDAKTRARVRAAAPAREERKKEAKHAVAAAPSCYRAAATTTVA